MIKRGYKLFREKNGVLHPLYVLAQEVIPIGEWIPAKEGPRNDQGKVKGKMILAYRPGWHIAGTKPEAPQITNQKGCVWCEVEFHADVDYQAEADERGWKNGRWAAVRACLDRIPVNGCYRYRTSAKQKEPWFITGEMRVVRILTDEEVKALCA